MASKRTVTEAAGTVLWRPSRKHGIKIAVIHRPRYDDWSLPKGKAEPGECETVTAARETEEETGYVARIGRHVDTISYRVSGGVKRVHYFAGQAVSGAFEANKEVDELKWLPAAKARVRLSYPRDRAVLDSFLTLPAKLDSVVLVRHAHAGQRETFVGADSKRPLDAKGKRQAVELAQRLAVFVPGAVAAAPLERCRQTVAPLADELELAVTDEPRLSEAEYEHDAVAARRRVVDAAVRKSASGPMVICSQGGVIPGIIKALANRSDLVVETTSTPKGAYWLLSFDGKTLCQADRYVLDY